MSYLKKILSLALILVMLLQPLHTFAQSTNNDCSEAKLRDLGVAIINCIGDTNTACTVGAGSAVLTGSDSEGKVFSYFVNHGLTADQAAGFMGNMVLESHFIIDNQEDSQPWGKGGWGLVQWTAARRVAIVRAMQEKGIGDLYNPDYADGKTPTDKQDTLLVFEMDYLWQELQTTHKKAYSTLISSANYTDATDAILTYFEAPFPSPFSAANRQNDSRWQRQMATRTPLSKAILEKYNGSSPTTPTTTSTTTTPGTAPTTGSTVIAIDPGHGGDIKEYVDPVSGLADRETNNQPEGDDMMQISQQVKAALETAGYTVVLLRTSGQPVPNKRARVDAAVQAKASLTISLHSTAGSINQVWPQRVDTYREYKDKKVSITNSEVAQKSQTYATAISTAREASEGHAISLDPGNSQQSQSFGPGRDVPSKGNVSLVQLWGQDIPWVYNEIGQDSGTALSSELKQKYADGLIKGIEAAIPTTGASTASTSSCTGSGGSGATGLSAKVLEYAWPEYKRASDGNTRPEEKPEWTTAWQAAKQSGRFVGGIFFPGNDCGGFVTTLMVDSGFDTTYNHGGIVAQGASGTTIQEAWLKDNWTSLGIARSIDTATLQPGDVAIKSGDGEHGHTFVFVGTIDGFNSKVASSSLDRRAPMAGHESLTDADFEWFRKK